MIEPPRWLWWLTLIGILGVGQAIVLIAFGAALGLTDPPYVGERVYTDEEFAWAGGKTLSLSSQETVWLTVPFQLSPNPFTLDVQARLSADSDPSGSWGVWFLTETAERVVIALHAEGQGGYVTARRCPTQQSIIEDCPPFIPDSVWRANHFLNERGTPNRIALYHMPDRPNIISVRFNREWMWDLPVQMPEQAFEWGLWARGGYEQHVMIEWEHLRIWLSP